MFLHKIPDSGLALLSWLLTCFIFIGVYFMVITFNRVARWIFGILTLILFSFEQFVGGVSLLRWNYFSSTFAIYGIDSSSVNAINAGVIGSALGVIIFICLLFPFLLATQLSNYRPGKWGVFGRFLGTWTKGAYSFSLFLVVELVVICVILFWRLLW